MSVLQDLLHLTWRGRLSMAYYAIRGRFIHPADDKYRCFMGAPIGDHVWCPREAPVGLWCEHHTSRSSG